ncbi:hypothetical protein DFS34DRAFT_30699 [Phlyctochytrium arcticum]|nr:hypothetical protein DFS34DRAFT_30699 [Phlyctochytrium arcticum]
MERQTEGSDARVSFTSNPHTSDFDNAGAVGSRRGTGVVHSSARCVSTIDVTIYVISFLISLLSLESGSPDLGTAAASSSTRQRNAESAAEGAERETTPPNRSPGGWIPVSSPFAPAKEIQRQTSEEEIPPHSRSTFAKCRFRGKSKAEIAALKAELQNTSSTTSGLASKKDKTTRGKRANVPIARLQRELLPMDAMYDPKDDGGARTTEGNEQKPQSRATFAVKIGLAGTADGSGGIARYPEVVTVIRDAVYRYNQIVFEGGQVFSLYTLAEINATPQKRLPFGNKTELAALITKCFQSVSVVDGDTPDLSNFQFEDGRVSAAFELHCNSRPSTLSWASRAGLTNPLTYAAEELGELTRQHVTTHLLTRIAQYFAVRLEIILTSREELAGKWQASDCKFLAARMAKKMYYNEGQAYILARQNNVEVPPIPQWRAPSSAGDIVFLQSRPGEKPDAKRRIALLAIPAAGESILAIFNEIAQRVVDNDPNGLPICKSKMDSSGNWCQSYFPIHIHMLRYLEELNDQSASSKNIDKIGASTKAKSQVSVSWARHQVERIVHDAEIADSVRISKHMRRRLSKALLSAANNDTKSVPDSLQNGRSRGKDKKRRGCVPGSILKLVQNLASRTRSELHNGKFHEPGVSDQVKVSPIRLWTLLPRPSLAPRNMKIDTQCLHHLWRYIDTERYTFFADKTQPLSWKFGLWLDSFELERLRGIRVPYFNAK